MTVLLVLAMFIIFLGVDWFVERRRAARAASNPATAAAPATESIPASPAATDPLFPVAEPVFVAGFQLPTSLHYHRGHTWARQLDDNTAVVGMDDFARRLTGRARHIELPHVGDSVEQGSADVQVSAGNRIAGLVMPVGGEVVEVNPALRDQPALATDDPYGRGWICKVRAPNLGAQFRNLIDGPLARRWTEDAREQLELRLMALSGSVLQDGGEPASDFVDHLDPDAWKSLRATFLLS